MHKRAVILGVGGMDGSYLAEILLQKGYEVHGVYRRSSVNNLYRLDAPMRSQLFLHEGDILDSNSIIRVLKQVNPHEIYNEADQDHVGFSHRSAGYSMSITAGAVANLLEAVLQTCPEAKFFQPLSATVFGNARGPQDLDTPFDPRSPYACAKVAAYYLCKYYREYHKLRVYTAIFYNHDSPRRGANYLLQKICRSAILIKNGMQDKLTLDNMSMRVDIGWAYEFMGVAYSIMQTNPDDHIVGTGEPVSIRTIAKRVWKLAGLDENTIVETTGGYEESDLIAYCETDWGLQYDAAKTAELIYNHYNKLGFK